MPLFEERSTLVLGIYALYSERRFLAPKIRALVDHLAGEFST